MDLFVKNKKNRYICMINNITFDSRALHVFCPTPDNVEVCKGVSIMTIIYKNGKVKNQQIVNPLLTLTQGNVCE